MFLRAAAVATPPLHPRKPPQGSGLLVLVDPCLGQAQRLGCRPFASLKVGEVARVGQTEVELDEPRIIIGRELDGSLEMRDLARERERSTGLPCRELAVRIRLRALVGLVEVIGKLLGEGSRST